MKIALYDRSYGSEVWEATDYRENDIDSLRVTNIVDVEFVDLPPEKVIPEQVARIDRGIEGLRAELGKKIAWLEDEKAKLLAITHEESS